MMCLGLWWDPEARRYRSALPTSSARAAEGQRQQLKNSKTEEQEEEEEGGHLPVPPIPQELQAVALRAADAARAALGGAPWPAAGPFDICIVNCYSKEGRLGLHRDSDESKASLDAGLPVVSLSLGLTAAFEFVPALPEEAAGEPSKREVHLKSGDAIVFGGPARLMPHSVRRMLSRSTPRGLSICDATGRPGRVNLTFRHY